jgi:hypothetical protein
VVAGILLMLPSLRLGLLLRGRTCRAVVAHPVSRQLDHLRFVRPGLRVERDELLLPVLLLIGLVDSGLRGRRPHLLL